MTAVRRLQQVDQDQPRGSTHIEGLGTYQYDTQIYDYLMQDGQRTHASLLAEVLERGINDDHKGDGVRTLVRRLRKGELAAMVAEWETATRENEREAETEQGSAALTEPVGPPSWLQISAEGATKLAGHLRVGLAQSDDAALRGFVESFVASLER